jgi:hypothetical protein
MYESAIRPKGDRTLPIRSLGLSYEATGGGIDLSLVRVDDSLGAIGNRGRRSTATIGPDVTPHARNLSATHTTP